MSHFAVAVITKDKNKIDEILKPYWEELEVEPYIEKTKEEIIEEARKRKGIFERGERTDFSEEYMNKYISASSDEELYQLEKDDYYEYDENGNQLSTYNPKSKWDWYEIGGRYINILLVKKDVKGIDGTPGLFCGDFLNKETPQGYKWTNGAKIKDVDFKKMEELSNEKFYTWALVDEKDWYEQGKMGWWAMNDATEKTTQSFIAKFQEYVNAEDNQEKYIVIVDCHI